MRSNNSVVPQLLVFPRTRHHSSSGQVSGRRLFLFSLTITVLWHLSMTVVKLHAQAAQPLEFSSNQITFKIAGSRGKHEQPQPQEKKNDINKRRIERFRTRVRTNLDQSAFQSHKSIGIQTTSIPINFFCPSALPSNQSASIAWDRAPPSQLPH